MHGLNANLPGILLFGALGLTSIGIILFLVRRRWDGMLQWLLVAHYVALVNVAVQRILQFLDAVSPEQANLFCVAPLVVVQVWLWYYLWKHIPRKSEK
jgi:hypothetical protein